MGMKTCPYCNKQISEFAISCPFCGNELSEAKTETKSTITQVNATLPVRYTHIAIATLISIFVPLVCQLISSSFYLIYGSDRVAAVISALWLVVVRSVLVLIVSGLVFWILSKISRFNTTQGFVIAALVCTGIHFLILAVIKVNSENVYAYLYQYIVIAVRVHTVAYGVGSSILLGCICTLFQSKKNKHLILSVSAITLSFAIFSLMAAFIGVRLLQQGITGGLLSICGAVAAIAVTLIVKTKFEE